MVRLIFPPDRHSTGWANRHPVVTEGSPKLPRLPTDVRAPASVPIAAPTGIGDRQLPLFARKATIQFPKKENSADSLGEVEADGGFRYYVKVEAHGRPFGDTEWITTQIAEEVHIGAPPPMVIELQNGDIVFGSRRRVSVN